MKNYKEINLRIEHQCPQCGAQVVIRETEKLLCCDFCRVKSVVVPVDYLRYYFPFEYKNPDEIFFIPYWRFCGIHFTIRSLYLKAKHMDTSFQAAALRTLPETLGLRTQTLKLKILNSSVRGRFIIPEEPSISVTSRVEQVSDIIAALLASGDLHYRIFIGETVSMIYTPVYVSHGQVFDGILNRPLSLCDEQMKTALSASRVNESASWKIELVAAQCPECGWDLNCERDSVVFLCKNCHSAWELVSKGLTKIRFGFIQEKSENTIYVPFWKMKVVADGEVALQSYADLLRFTNAPRLVKPENEKNDICFFLPAFKVHPQLFLRLSRQFTSFQFQIKPEQEFPERGEILPATLNFQEANKGVKIVMAELANDKKKIFPLISSVKVQISEFALIYVPFRQIHGEYVQPALQIGINCNALR